MVISTKFAHVVDTDLRFEIFFEKGATGNEGIVILK